MRKIMVRVTDLRGLDKAQNVKIGDTAEVIRKQRMGYHCYNPRWCPIIFTSSDTDQKAKPTIFMENSQIEFLKEAPPMKLELTDKPISRKSVYDALDDKDCKEALELYSSFEAVFADYCFTSSLTNEAKIIDFLEARPKARDFALRKGFVREIRPKVEKGQIYRHISSGQYYQVQAMSYGTWMLALVAGVNPLPVNGDYYGPPVKNIEEVFHECRELFEGPLPGRFVYEED